MDRRSDRGGIVVSWLVKVILVLAVVGVVLFDVFAIAYARVTAADDARSIARAASDALILQRAEPAEAIAIAEERAIAHGVTLHKKDLVIAKDGTVTVHVHRDAPTLVTQRLGPLGDYTRIDETYVTPAIP